MVVEMDAVVRYVCVCEGGEREADGRRKECCSHVPGLALREGAI